LHTIGLSCFYRRYIPGMYLAFSFVNVSSSPLFLPLASRAILLEISHFPCDIIHALAEVCGAGLGQLVQAEEVEIQHILRSRPPCWDALRTFHYGPGEKRQDASKRGREAGRGYSCRVFSDGDTDQRLAPAPDLLLKLGFSPGPVLSAIFKWGWRPSISVISFLAPTVGVVV